MAVVSTIQKSQLEGTKRLDAEYYQPEYLALQKKLERTKSITPWGEIEGKFITGPFGSEFNTDNYVQEGKYRYVRGKDVKDFALRMAWASDSIACKNASRLAESTKSTQK